MNKDSLLQKEPLDYQTAIPIGYYDDIFHRGKGMQSKWHHLKFKRIREELAGFKRHLDVGCGPGTFIGTLCSAYQSLGIDIAQEQIDFAQTKYRGPGRDFKCVAAVKMLFDEGSFDVVTSIELIEHLPQQTNLEMLMDAHRVLRPGGKIVVTTPNFGGAWPFLEAIVNRVSKVTYEDQHISHYNKNSLFDLLCSAGFKNVLVETFLLAAPFGALLHWKLSDFIDKIEPGFLESRFGFLLLGSGVK